MRSALQAAHLTPAALAAAAPASSGASSRYLGLPLSLISPRVVSLAKSIVAGQTTVYGKARALQDYLRSSRFSYSLNVRAGHDENALETFLFRTRRGYCEQFAGAYAVLARLVNLPTRVAVGFTPGDVRLGTYHVLGLHAHAWPEVLIGSYGWVAFEPTPGRGAPGAQAYTGVPPSQATSAGGGSSTGDASAATTTPTSTPTLPSAPPRTQPQEPTSSGRGSGSTPVGLVVRLGFVLAGAAALAALWLGLVSLTRRSLHRRRWRQARGPADQVMAAWADAAEALAGVGVPRLPAETLDEYGRRAEAALRHLGYRAAPPAGPDDAASQAVRALAADAVIASYAREGATMAAAATRSRVAADLLRQAVTAQAGLWTRLRRRADPSGLWQAWLATTGRGAARRRGTANDRGSRAA